MLDEIPFNCINSKPLRGLTSRTLQYTLAQIYIHKNFNILTQLRGTVSNLYQRHYPTPTDLTLIVTPWAPSWSQK